MKTWGEWTCWVKAVQGSPLVARTGFHLDTATNGTRWCHCPLLSWVGTALCDHPRLSQMHCSELSHQQHHARRTGWTTDVFAPSISLKTQRQPLEGARRKMPKSCTGNNSSKPTVLKKNFKLTAWYLFTWNCLLSPAGNWIILLV